MKLRTDEKQWLIYDEFSVVTAVRAIELICLGIAGRAMTKSGHIAVRAIGHLALRIADARMRASLGFLGSEAQVATGHAEKIITALSGGEPSPEELEELYAAAFWLDSRLNAAGITGDGWHRELVKGTR